MPSLGDRQGVVPGSELDTSGKYEFRCEECGCRCTQSPTLKDVSYGHAPSCSEKVDKPVKPGGKDGHPTTLK